MQTFLPYPCYEQSARVLDRARLGKQRVEAYQILCSLHRIRYNKDTHMWELFDSRWKNHPAVLMWENHSLSLCEYTKAMISEWSKRGYKDSCLEKILYFESIIHQENIKPSFIGNKEFHASHRSNLLRKFPEHYRQFGWKEPDNLSYFWPV